MRRKDKEITDRKTIDEIIVRAQVCRLGLCKDNRPYVVPVNFGYDGERLFFHTFQEGMKIDYLTTNPQVCFELEDGVYLLPHAEQACKWSTSFYSVIGFGVAQEITDQQEKQNALNHIMRHYSGREWEFDSHELARIRVWCILIESLTGKKSKDKE